MDLSWGLKGSTFDGCFRFFFKIFFFIFKKKFLTVFDMSFKPGSFFLGGEKGKD